MSNKEIRIKIRDFDPCTDLMILEDAKGLLSPLTVSLDTFTKWRIDHHRDSGSRLQMYMTFIKKQGGKQTILSQVEERRKSSFYKGFR